MRPRAQITGQEYNDIDPTVKFGKCVVLRNFLYIGKNSEIGDNTRLANSCNIDVGTKIGKNCNFQVAVQTTMNNEIGDGCFFGAMVCLADEKYPATGEQVRKPVKVGKNVIIGTRTTIVASNIGDNAVIGAHSLVMHDVPANEVWGGVPIAKPIIKNGKKLMREDYDKNKFKWEHDLLSLSQ